MTLEENKALVRGVYEEVVNRGDLDAAHRYIAHNFVVHNAQPGVAPGLEGFRQLFSALFAAFPDLHEEVEDLVAEGDRVAARVTRTGTHQGAFMGVAPTGRRFQVTAIDIFRIANGRLAEVWTASDHLGMLRQLGILSLPG